MSEVIFYGNKKLAAVTFNLEKGIQVSVKDNAKLIFGSSSIYNEQSFFVP